MASPGDALRVSHGAEVARQPQRTCIVCRRKGDQRSFLRIARGSDGELTLIVAGAPTGRSAYVCESEECTKGVLAKDRLARALRKPVSAEDREGLERKFLCKLR